MTTAREKFQEIMAAAATMTKGGEDV